MTTPGKNYPALPAFLPTPDSTPETSACRSFSVPDNDDWLGLLMGALNVLSQEWAYYPWGSLTPAEAADKWNDIINQAYADSFTSSCGGMIQAPYWDDESGDDADDEVAPEDQTWYGQWDGETFTESLAYVFLTNFLSTLVSTGAAIKFLTIPRAFRVAVRQNPHGANLLLFLDGGLFKVINGYSPVDKVAEFLISSPGTELLLVVDDTHDPDATPNSDGVYVVDVIRKRLAVDEVQPPNIRFTGTPPTMQTTYDDGATWIDTPESDPRYNPAALLTPLTPYGGIECDVAARMTAELEDTLTNFIAAGDAAQFATEIMALIAFPFGWVGWILDVILLAFDTLIDIGQANIEAAFTSTVYDDIRCTFNCYVDDNGQISQTSLDAAYEQIKTDHPGTVASTIDTLRWLYTDVAMSNAGVTRDETGDCSGCDSCEWVYEWDFTDGSTHGWRIYTDTSLGSYGAYDGTRMRGQRLPPWELFPWIETPSGCVITGSSFYAEGFHGTGIGNSLKYWDITAPGDPPSITINSTVAFPAWGTLGWHTEGGLTPTAGIGFQFTCDSNNTGYIYIHKIRLQGTGSPPVGGVRVNSLT